MERKMLHIPKDVVVEIFLRLPAKSLVQLRWTCKYWFDLITRDDDFIKMHLHRSTTITHDDEILRISNRQSNDGYKLFQHSLDYNDTTRVGDVSSEVCIALLVDCPRGYHPEILSSCNGLILFYQSWDGILYIWNPCTKEYRILPQPPSIKGLSCMYPQYHYYGFGYDHTTDDYKVIRSGKSHLRRSDVQVYTLGTNSWRKVDGPDTFWYYYEKGGVFVNGVLYWIDFVNNDVISFDIGKEKFRHVSKIPNLSHRDVYWYEVSMRVFEGSLCVVLKSKDQQNCTEMWVMEDYAINEPLWTKLSTIPNQGDCLFPIVPLRFTRNGEILMVTNKKDLSLYDPKNNDVKTLCRICEYPNRHFIDVLTESLVSLNSGTYTGQERRKEQETTEKKSTNKVHQEHEQEDVIQETTAKKSTNKEHQEHEQEDVIQETTTKKSTNKEHQEHEQEDVMMACKNDASFLQCFQFLKLLWSCITFS